MKSTPKRHSYPCQIFKNPNLTKKMKYSLILTILVLVSCKNKNVEIQADLINSGYEIVLKDSISIPLNSDDFYRSFQTHVVERNDTTYLYRESFYTHSIDVFNWTKKRKIERILLKQDGPNQIKGFGGAPWLPLKGDSLFIANLSGITYITLKDSVLITETPNLLDMALRFYALNPQKPQRIDNNIFMYVASDYMQKDIQFKDRPLIVSYNLDENTTTVCNIKYPKEFMDDCWSEHHTTISFASNNLKQLVLSFPFTEKLYVCDIRKDEIIKVIENAGSKNTTEIVPYKACDFNNIEKYFRYLKSVPRYEGIIYNQYKDLYYRIVALPADKNLIDGNRNQDVVMPFSIIVLDNKFNVIAEKVFPSNSYDIRDYFVNEEDSGFLQITKDQKTLMKIGSHLNL